jgi:RNA polymerase-binding transcription factor DksA
MATKKKITKPAPKKAVSKPSKPAAKAKAPVKKAAKPVAKAPAKKAAKPAQKPVAKKPVAKAKPVAKKAAPVKKAVKPVAKKAAPVKKTAKPVAKAPVKKVEVKKAAPAKKPTPPVAKAPVKVVAKPAVKAKPEPAKKTAPVAKVPSVVKKVVPKNPKDIKITPAKPVAVPKIATKTVKKYAPDFTKSVLDYKKQDAGAPMTRYSDSELMEFKEIIARKIEAAKKELHYLQGLITRKDETGGDESENRYMTMEDGSLSMEREQLSQMASRQITFIDHLEKALMRIENKTYGVCRVTGKLIDKARLKAVPHATLSIEAKMGLVK